MNQQQLFNEINSIIVEGTEPYRNFLNKKIHIADISYVALQQSAPYLSENQYIGLIGFLQNRFIKASGNSLEDAVLEVKNYKENNPGRGLRSRIYYKDPSEAYVVSGSYESLQTGLSRAFKGAGNLPEFSKGASLKVFTGANAQGKTLINIGHIAGTEAITSTPLGTQLEDVLVKLSGLQNTRVYSEIQHMINRLNKAHNAKAIYSLTRGDVFKNPVLADMVLLVTVQSADLNNDFSKTEARISRRLRALFNKPEVIKFILNAKGSNNIIEDIAEKVMVALGATRTAGSIHSKKPSKKSIIRLGGSASDTVNKAVLPKLPRLRTTTGQFTSLAALQRLLDASLVQRVKENMGTGSRRDILNLRSGRFAESVKVDRLSQSREGMITAFYTYMKNPYATFSPGGQQEFPKTRDPKLLIAKSIREIGATMVANRMRAVLV